MPKIIANLVTNFRFTFWSSFGFCFFQQLLARWPVLLHHWQTTGFSFAMKLTLLLNRHVAILYPGFEHNWQISTFVCTIFTGYEDWGCETDIYRPCVRVFYKFDIKISVLKSDLIWEVDINFQLVARWLSLWHIWQVPELIINPPPNLFWSNFTLCLCCKSDIKRNSFSICNMSATVSWTPKFLAILYSISGFNPIIKHLHISFSKEALIYLLGRVFPEILYVSNICFPKIFTRFTYVTTFSFFW